MATSIPQVFVTEGRGTGARHLLPEVSIVSVEQELNGVGSAEIAFDPLAENATQVLLSERELEIQDGDDMVYVGTLRDIQGNSTALTAKSDGLFDYLRFRFVLTGNISFVNVEQLTIASTLMTYAQDDAEQGTNADLNIDIAGFAPSGISRSREYVSERKHNLFEALSEFPTLEEGFDMEIVCNPNGQRVWTPYYPQKGTVKDIPLEYGLEIVDYSYIESSRKQATKVTATGGVAEQVNGERLKMERTYEDVAASTRYGVHVSVLPSGARSDGPWLQSRAEGAVNTRKNPVRVPEITVTNASEFRTLIGVGDSVPVRIDHGRVQIADVLRIKKIQWRPPEDQLVITFLEPISE